jgi:hypothetical protein
VPEEEQVWPGRPLASLVIASSATSAVVGRVVVATVDLE